MRCPDCGNEIPHVVCSKCQAHSPTGSKYCCRCGEAIPEEPERETVQESDFSKRKLCSDGNCIGVIGKNGRCQLCGKPYEGDPV